MVESEKKFVLDPKCFKHGFVEMFHPDKRPRLDVYRNS